MTAARRPRSARASRRAGATFTMVVLAVAVLILVTSSLLVRASQHALEMAALEARRSRVREAAFAGLRWAGRDSLAGASVGRSQGAGRLLLSGELSVSVRWALVTGPEGVRLDALSHAEVQGAPPVEVEARMPQGQDGDWVLEGFAVR